VALTSRLRGWYVPIVVKRFLYSRDTDIGEGAQIDIESKFERDTEDIAEGWNDIRWAEQRT